jgi:hypothetical protein
LYTYPYAYTAGVREEYVSRMTGANGAIRVAPNPANDLARITLTPSVAGTVSLTLDDALARNG